MTAARVVVIGAGGNIGSHLVPHLGRMETVREVVLIDQGTYEWSNLAGQDITSREVGRKKAVVLAHRLRRINRALVVHPVAQAVEDVPLGSLRGDVLLACLDSRAARQSVNQAARRLGMPWLDAGVHADGLLARVSAYAPDSESPCLECPWDDRDYAALEQAYPCAGGGSEPPATGAPSSLGALAASLQALECRKLLAGPSDHVVFGRHLVIDASTHKHYVTAFRRNRTCRLPEHQPWTIQPFYCSLQDTLERVLELCGGAREPVTLSVAGRRFSTKLTCPGCGSTRGVLRLADGTRRAPRCNGCGALLVTAGFDLRDRLELRHLSGAERSRSLHRLGLRHGDVFTLATGGRDLHCEVCVPPIKTASERATA